jgi:type VI secretion system Hcp family effector
VFNGSPRYLEIAVRAAGSADPYTLLDPRQPILPSPYAIRSLTSSQADGLSVSCLSCITASNMANGAVTADKIAPQQVVKSIAGLKDDVGINAGPGISIAQANNTLTISSVPLPGAPPLTHLTLVIPGVTGGNADGSIEVFSASSGLARVPSLGGGTGSGDPADFANLKVTKGVDRASYRLQQAAAAGTHYTTVTLNFYRIDPGTLAETLTYRLILGNSVVRLIQPSFSAPQEVGMAREDVEFGFEVIKWEYLIPGMPSVIACWNLQSLTASCSGV